MEVGTDVRTDIQELLPVSYKTLSLSVPLHKMENKGGAEEEKGGLMEKIDKMHEALWIGRATKAIGAR